VKFRHKAVGIILAMLLVLLILFPVACGCPGGESTSPATSATLASPTTPTATEVKGKSFIWEITSATTSVYLLGSVHIARPDIYPLDNVIEDAFASAKYLVVEVNVHNIDTQNVNSLLLEHGVYPQGEGLRENVSPSLYDALAEQFERFSIDIATLDVYRPWVISTTLEQLILQDMGYLPENGIDYYFLDKAAQTKKILELETVEYQLELLYSLPDEVMIEALEYDIENMPLQEDMEELFQAWQDGDVTRMESSLFEGLTEEPGMATYYEKLFDERNFNMAAKIEEYLADDETYFIVVGAGHLVGENGLLNLLTEKGYAIEQLYDSD
jgi:uncharacterized protein YbaP (TraB family)